MSDILKNLLQAYSDALDTAQGLSMPYLVHHEIVQPPLSLLSTWHANLPTVLIQPQGYTLTPDTLAGPCRSDRKLYTIVLSGFVEYYDENYGATGNMLLNYTGAIDIAQDLETLFNRQTFGISLACVLTNVSFSQLAMTQFASNTGSFVHSCELTFQHDWIDRRVV